MASTTTERMPVLYLSHGAPPLVDHERWPAELAAGGGGGGGVSAGARGPRPPRGACAALRPPGRGDGRPGAVIPATGWTSRRPSSP